MIIRRVTVIVSYIGMLWRRWIAEKCFPHQSMKRFSNNFMLWSSQNKSNVSKRCNCASKFYWKISSIIVRISPFSYMPAPRPDFASITNIIKRKSFNLFPCGHRNIIKGML